MSLPSVLQRLELPVIGAPMFIASNPLLVTEQCRAGIVLRLWGQTPISAISS